MRVRVRVKVRVRVLGGESDAEEEGDLIDDDRHTVAVGAEFHVLEVASHLGGAVEGDYDTIHGIYKHVSVAVTYTYVSTLKCGPS